MASTEAPPEEPLDTEQAPAERIQQYAAERYQRMEACVSRNPLAAVLTSFGGGVGLGLLLSAALVKSARGKKYDARTAERLGRQMIDAVVSVLSESFTSQSES